MQAIATMQASNHASYNHASYNYASYKDDNTFWLFRLLPDKYNVNKIF